MYNFSNIGGKLSCRISFTYITKKEGAGEGARYKERRSWTGNIVSRNLISGQVFSERMPPITGRLSVRSDSFHKQRVQLLAGFDLAGALRVFSPSRLSKFDCPGYEGGYRHMRFFLFFLFFFRISLQDLPSDKITCVSDSFSCISRVCP
jgi:hypothetical protein